MNKKEENKELLTKRVSMSSSFYKELQKVAIDLDIDDDGRLTPDTLGKAIEVIYLSQQKHKSDMPSIHERIDTIEKKVNNLIENLKFNTPEEISS